MAKIKVSVSAITLQQLAKEGTRRILHKDIGAIQIDIVERWLEVFDHELEAIQIVPMPEVRRRYGIDEGEYAPEDVL